MRVRDMKDAKGGRLKIIEARQATRDCVPRGFQRAWRVAVKGPLEVEGGGGGGGGGMQGDREPQPHLSGM